MAIFSKVTDLMKLNINDLISKSDNPKDSVSEVIGDLGHHIKDVTQVLNQTISTEASLKMQLGKAINSSIEWEKKAKSALKNGNTELAKRALENKLVVDRNVDQFQLSYDNISSQVNELKKRLSVLREKLKEAIDRSKNIDEEAEKIKKGNVIIYSKEIAKEKFASQIGFPDVDVLRAEPEDIVSNPEVDKEIKRLMSEMESEQNR